MTIILGPAVCQDCRAHVYWDGWRWVTQTGIKHTCRRTSLARLGRLVRNKKHKGAR